VSSSIGFSLGTAVIGSFFLGQFYGSVVDGVLRAEHVTVSAEQRNDLVIALEDAAETATEATQQQFLNRLTPTQRQLLEGIFETAMFDAQRATLSPPRIGRIAPAHCIDVLAAADTGSR